MIRPVMNQQIRFATAPDGVRLAYAIHGTGPPLVKVANWLSHLEFDWLSPVWRHWLTELGSDHTVIRYDARGSGLSDWDVPEVSFAAWVRDLETIVEAVGLDRFDLFGMSQGGAVATAYAVSHPERPRRLVLYGAYGRGRLVRARSADERAEAELLLDLTRFGWGKPNPAFRRVFSALFFPEATPEQIAAFDDLQRVSASPENAVRFRQVFNTIDVRKLAHQVRVPTLILHVGDDGVVPFNEGRLLASRIPGARFVPLQGRNHLMLADESAWPSFLAEVRTFLAGERIGGRELVGGGTQAVEFLSRREREVLRLVAAGLTNAEISADLVLSTRTVERHLSNIYAKLGVSGKSARAAAAARGARLPQALPKLLVGR